MASLLENLAGMGREQLQQLERLPAKLEDLPGRAAEFRTPLVKLEAGKFEGPCPAHGIRSLSSRRLRPRISENRKGVTAFVDDR